MILGKSEFILEQDAGCSKDLNMTISIVLTACQEEEFTCRDGLCINMVERCDKIIDCPNDSSDEENCGMINFDQTYKKEFSPVTKYEDKTIKKTDIRISVDLLTILKIKEVDSIFACQLNLYLSWVDQRLLYNNLKKDPNYNTLSVKERSSIWMPKILFANTNKREGLLKDDKAQASVHQNANFTIASDKVVDNTFCSENLKTQ